MWSVIHSCQGESLSSWLVRFSLATGCDPLSLTSAIWPGWRSWTHDLDRSLTEQQLNALVIYSGTDELSLYRMTIAGMLGHSVGQPVLPVNGVVTGVRPLGIRNRNCLTGAQYCPLCLAEDPSPYFRLRWRLAVTVSCPKHMCLLKTSCPLCGEPVQYHRLTATDENIYRCYKCLADLRYCTTRLVESPALLFQKAVLNEPEYQPEAGERPVSFEDNQIALGLFYVRLIRAMARKHHGKLRELLSAAGVTAHRGIVSPTGLPVEYLSVSERVRLFSTAWPLMWKGPEQFSLLAREHGLTLNGISEFNPPECMKRLLADLPQHNVPHRKRQSGLCQSVCPRSGIERRWALFLRRMDTGRND